MDIETPRHDAEAGDATKADAHDASSAVATDDEKDQDKKSCGSQLWQMSRPSVLCPDPSWLLHVTLVLIGLILSLGALVSLLGAAALPPDGGIFQLVTVIVLAEAVGRLVHLIHLPPLLGMLLTGIALRNVGAFYIDEIYIGAVASLRTGAMVVILIKAGLGLDPQALRRLSCMVLRLAFCPCIVEAATGMCAARLLLGMPWIWGLLLGSVLAAVSPAVVVPSLLSLKERGYGEDKGIATLVVAASSMDDIAAISAFGIFLGIIFSEGSLMQQLLQGPLEVLMGLGFGICYGLLMIYIPHAKIENVVQWRAAFVCGGGILAVFGSQQIGYDGAGPLGCIAAAFVASCGWRAEAADPGANNPVEQVVSQLWQVFQPVLFGLIGTEIVISELDASTVSLGLGVLCCGLLLRVLTVWIITLGGTLTVKEQIFVAIAWLPKATVQAALAPVALDIARKNDAPEEIIMMAEQVLTVAVLSILVTAPIGAVAISVFGPRLLSRPANWQAQQPHNT